MPLHLPYCAGFEQPLAGSGALGMHRLVEAMKHAFALRMNLGGLPSLIRKLFFSSSTAIWQHDAFLTWT